MDTEFQVGDFVELIKWISIEDQGQHFRLVINSCVKSPSGREGLKLIYLEGDHGAYFYWCIGVPGEYAVVQPTKELINEAKNQLEKALCGKSVDNLTYVEICARLKEHERSLNDYS